MNKNVKNKIILISILVVAIVFIFIGINNGDMNELYNKARLICLECIGIG